MAVKFRIVVRIEEVAHTEQSVEARIEQGVVHTELEVEHIGRPAARLRRAGRLAGRRKPVARLAGRKRLVAQVVGLQAGRLWSWRGLRFSGPVGSRRTVRLSTGGRGRL